MASHMASYLWLALGCRAVVKLDVTVPIVAVKSKPVPATLNDGILRADDARTEAAIEPSKDVILRITNRLLNINDQAYVAVMIILDFVLVLKDS